MKRLAGALVFHGPIALYALLYSAGLFAVVRFAFDRPLYVAAAVVALGALAAVAERLIARHFFFAIVPVVLSVAALALLFFIDSAVQQAVLIGIVGVLVYGVALGSYRLSRQPHDAVARGMVVAGATAAVFFFYAAVFAVYLNFVVPQWAVVGSIFVVTSVIAWQYFVMIARGLFIQTVVYSVALGAVLAEMAFAAVMWPFGYLTTAVVLLMVYYILWDLGQSFFLDRLSKARLVVNVVFFLLLALVVLLSAQWLPVV